MKQLFKGFRLLRQARFLLPLAAAALLSCSEETATEQPNVILIITDDQGYGDLGHTGNPWIKTPARVGQRNSPNTA